MTAKRSPNPLAQRLAAEVAKGARSPSTSAQSAAETPPPAVPPVAPFPPAAGATPSAPTPPAQKPLKQTKTYSLNPDEITKIEKAMDFLRSNGVYDASKAAIVRAMVRQAKIDPTFLEEVMSDKD